MNYNTIYINSLDQFNKSIKFEKDSDFYYLFRGQKDDLPLYSRLYRKVIKYQRVDEIYEIEKSLLNRFKEYIGNSGNNAHPLDDWDCLTISQHYDLSTRLLDWSENPFIALWFAFSSDKENGDDRVVWQMQAHKSLIVNYSVDSPFNQRFIKIFKPRLVDIRVYAQDSWFSVQDIQFFGPGGDGLPHFHSNDPLEEIDDLEFSLVKYSIKNELKCEIIKFLESHGINHSSVYPNLIKRLNEIEDQTFNNKPQKCVSNK